MHHAPGADRPACPFCAGAEAETPPETDADRDPATAPDTPGWRVRAVPNKYPVLAPEEGVHEVVVATPRHVTRAGELTHDEARRLAVVVGRRLRAAEDDPRDLWPFAFLNQGREAGASLSHLHAQVVGIPFDPPRLAHRAAAFADLPRCPVCADLAGAAAEGRVVLAAGPLVAWLPHAPAWSAGIRVAPRDHAPRWVDDPDPGALGPVLADLAGRVHRGLGREALNAWVNQGRAGRDGRYHWHADLVPRLGFLAGLELGSGALAGANDPAALAARLREPGGGDPARG